jgi:hypothetical protein
VSFLFNNGSNTLVKGEVCGFQVYAANYRQGDTIQVYVSKLNGAYGYIYSGGYGIDTSLTKDTVDITKNKTKFEYPADQRIYIII